MLPNSKLIIDDSGACLIEPDSLSPIALLLPVQDLINLSDEEMARKIRGYFYPAIDVLIEEILGWVSAYDTFCCPAICLVDYKELLEKLAPHNQNVIPVITLLDILTDIQKLRSWDLEEFQKQVNKKKRKKGGYVYLAYSETGHYKIGYSIGPENRIRVFDTIMPVAVSMIHTFEVDDMPSAESILHFIFDDYRYQGEWFNLNQDHVEIIKRISGYRDKNIIWGES